MNFIVSRLNTFTLFSIIITALFACTKITNTDIGSGLIPPVDGVKTKDTVLDVITKNESFDTVGVGFSDDHVLGYINDPVFGTTSASINFQVSPPFTPLSFGADKASLRFDSVVLSLSYKGVWGDSLSEPPLGLRVYEMDPENKFTVDSFYNNTVSFEKGTELTEFNTAKDIDITKLNDVDTLKTYNEDATNQVRIRLSESFGEKLLTQFDSTNAYQDDSTFRSYFRGFIVEAEQRGNALLRISLSDTSTRLSLYYHFTDASTGLVDTAVRRFSPSALSSASSNTIKRNYQGTDINKYFPANSNMQDSLLFIQTSPGTYARIKVPGLTGLPNIIVHRAELLMQQVPDAAGSDATFTSPNLFLAAYSQDSGRRFAIPFDVQFSGGTISNLASFGVSPIKKFDGLSNETISTYSFDISRYAQSIITKNDTLNDFILWAPYNYYLPPIENTPYAYPISTPALNAAAIGRVRLGGGNNSRYKMRLHIVYSLIQ